MQYQNIDRKTRRNLERYAERLAQEVRDLESGDRRYRAAEHDEWAAEYRAIGETLARMLEEGRAPLTACTAFDADEAAQAAREAEEAAKAAREGFRIPDELYTRARAAADVARGLRALAARQAAALAVDALEERAEEWTAKPAHYKATKNAIRRICDEALSASGFRGYLTCDYGDWDYPCLRVYASHLAASIGNPSYEVRMSRDRSTERLESVGKWAGRIQAAEWREWDPKKARRMLERYRADEARARKMADAYRERLAAIADAYRPFEMRDGIAEAGRVNYC